MDECFRALAEEIIFQSIKDLDSLSILHRETAKQFLNSEWCKFIVDSLNINIELFKELVERRIS